MDSPESGISVARRSYPGVPFVLHDIQFELPQTLRETFDAVISLEVVEHLLLPRNLFRRASEAVKPGGYLLLSTPYHGYLKNLALAVTNSFDSHWHPLRDFGHIKFFSKATLLDLAKEQGYECVKYKQVGRISALAKLMVLLLRRSDRLDSSFPPGDGV